MDNGDKSWMNLLRWTDEYIRGVNDFLDKAFERASQENEILCPCKKCLNRYWYYRNVLEDHLVVHGFVDGYTKWGFHGEGFSSRNTPHPSNDDEGSTMRDDIDGLLHDTFRNIEARQRMKKKLGKDYLKMQIKLIKEAFPFAQVPESFNKARNMIKDLGLHYEKIHACPNDCMLFWKENANMDNCSICGSSRWKSSSPLTKANSKIPTKVLRHPADGEAWKAFDYLHPNFSRDRRNPEYIMLSMIIPGPSSPGNDIDVYLRPLIEELKELWETGIDTFDAETNQSFRMRAALLWTVGNFFRAICSKVIRQRDLETMQSEIVEITCELEKIFHPIFFDIMPHLPIHLVNEIKLGGPAHLRWMHTTERNLCNYKAFVRNRSCPEASIAEGFVADECLTFCSRYLHDGVKTKFIRYQTMDDECSKNLSPIFPNIGHPIGSKKKDTFFMDSQLCFETHRYALFNTGDEQMEKFIEEHKNLIVIHSRSNAWVRATDHSREFSNWFKEKVKNIVVPDYLRWLAKGPNMVSKRYTTYFINGYRFHTKERDFRCKTQNSGVTLSAITDSFASSRDQNSIDGEVIYYGAIQDIIEIDYWGCFRVVLFRCDWFHNEIDNYELTRVYFNRLCSRDDPFVLASQVYQVFYVEDPTEKDVYYARSKVPVDLYDLEKENCPNIGDTFWREPNNDISSSSRLLDVDIRWSREDVPVDIIYTPSNAQNSHDTIVETSEEEDEFDDTDWDWMETDD
ncbi:uncharacterized protein [Nicotiana sylvestris]|uniref:uncharacterized protein n=1 Tax=Nicotiana sylvestris TaxID=4096 RepID=UPI00388C3641